MKRYTLSVFAALTAIAVIPFVAAQSPATVVRMTGDKSFEPKTITVKPGEPVVWKNVSDMVHTVTDIPAQAITKGDAALPPNAKEFDSGLIQPGKDYSTRLRFPAPINIFVSLTRQRVWSGRWSWQNSWCYCRRPRLLRGFC